jgi:hypothetical protein
MKLPVFLTLEVKDEPKPAMLELDQTDDLLKGLPASVHGFQEL